MEIVTWDGKHTVIMGDAYLRAEDAEFAATTVRYSLEQFLKASQGIIPLGYLHFSVSLVNEPDSFSVCKNNIVPSRTVRARVIIERLVQTPVPGLAIGLGAHPRFRSELGTYLGVSAALNATTIFGGVGKDQLEDGAVRGLEGNFRFGFGLEGVLDKAADGSIFVQLGWRLDGPSTSQFANTGGTIPTGSVTAAIPGRTAYNIRWRLPFWLIPGDLLIAGPFLYLFSPGTITKMGLVAANGELILWQSANATNIGRL